MKHLLWIDNLRFFAMVCVLYGHASHPYPCAPIVHNVDGIIVAFNMYVFFYLSGYLSFHRDSQLSDLSSLGCRIWCNFKRVLVPALMPGFCAWLLSYLLHRPFFPPYYWFLDSMFLILLLFDFSRLIEKYVGELWRMLFFIFLVSLTAFIPLYNLYWTAEFSLIFLFGYYDRKYGLIDKLFMMVNSKFLIFLLLTFFILTYRLSYYVKFYTHGLFDYLPYSLGWWAIRYSSAISILCVLVYMFRRSVNNNLQFITYFGSKTIAIYTISVMIQENVYSLGIGNSGDSYIDAIKMVFFFITYSLLTFIIVSLIDKTKITRVLFLGEKV